jgi:hypothetical protein
MKIKANQLKNLILEYLNEDEKKNKERSKVYTRHSSIIHGVGGKKIDGKFYFTLDGKPVVESFSLNYFVEKYGLEALQELVKRLLRVGGPYEAAKRDADVPDADKYFHYLAFYNMMTETDLKPFSQEEAAAVIITLGLAKEGLDLKYSDTRIAKVGELSAMMEFFDDHRSNLIGLVDGLNTLKGKMSENDAHKKALGRLTHTLGKLKSKSAGTKKYYEDAYGWVSEAHPSLFGDDIKFIQPRYHVLLSPRERSEAIKKGDRRKTLKKATDAVFDIKGSLRMK